MPYFGGSEHLQPHFSRHRDAHSLTRFRLQAQVVIPPSLLSGQRQGHQWNEAKNTPLVLILILYLLKAAPITRKVGVSGLASAQCEIFIIQMVLRGRGLRSRLPCLCRAITNTIPRDFDKIDELLTHCSKSGRILPARCLQKAHPVLE